MAALKYALDVEGAPENLRAGLREIQKYYPQRFSAHADRRLQLVHELRPGKHFLSVTHGRSIVVPLVSFNLGVELGQVAIAAVALPLIWKLRERPAFVKRWVPVCSVIVALLGAYWFVQRVWF